MCLFWTKLFSLRGMRFWYLVFVLYGVCLCPAWFNFCSLHLELWCFVMQVCSFRGDIIGACMLCWAPVVMFVECMNLSQLRHPSGMLTKMNEQKL